VNTNGEREKVFGYVRAKARARESCEEESGKKVAAKKPVAVEIVAVAAAASSQRSTPVVRTLQPSATRLHDEIRQRAYELYRERVVSTARTRRIGIAQSRKCAQNIGIVWISCFRY